jgi:Sec-independent protein secretion pathway component TatC
VLCVIGGAFVTPGDALAATLAMIVPLYFLYELGIVLSTRVYRWRERRDSSGDSPSAPDAA